MFPPMVPRKKNKGGGGMNTKEHMRCPDKSFPQKISKDNLEIASKNYRQTSSDKLLQGVMYLS